MYLKSKLNFKKFLIALLSMLMAVMLAFSVGCDQPTDPSDDGGDDDPSSTTTTEATDYQLIKNGDFEFGSTDKTTYPLSSSINWSKSMGSDVTIAPSSKGSSGIIDTGDKYEDISSKNKPSENPGTPYSKGLIADSELEYDYEDEDKRVNPKLDGKKILMINNQNNGLGTAQSYKASSAISVAVDEFYLLSFWIKTVDLSSVYDANPGAYVKITSSAGSKSNDDFIIKGINTNGEWVKFNLAMKGSSLTSTTVNLIIGLGEGNGTDQNGFVEGFTFIDNVSLKSINEAEYQNASSREIKASAFSTETLSLPSSYVDNDTQSNTPTDKYSIVSCKFDFTYSLTTNALGVSAPEFANAKTNYPYANGNTIGVGDLATAKGVVPSAFGDNDSFNQVVYMNFVNYSAAKFETQEVEVKAGEYKYITFFAKVNVSNANADKLKVEVIDQIADLSEQDTVLYEGIDTSGLESERYNDWIKYQIFINNPTDKDTSFKVKFTFGSDKDTGDGYELQKGYALVADLAIADVDEKLYNLASTNSYISKKQIYGEYISYSKVTETETGSDTYGISVDKTQTFTLRDRPATNVSGFNFKSTISDYTNQNKLLYGIINSKYYKDSTNVYGSSPEFTNNLTGLNDLKMTGNDYAQVIVMDNKEAGYSRFVTSTYTVTADTYTKISVKVKAYGDAVSNVSLVSSELNAETREYDVMKFELGEFSKPLTSKVTSSSYQKDGWTTVHFYVHAGNEDIALRVMVTNGDTQTASRGVVLFDGVTYASVDGPKFQADKNALKLNFEQFSQEAEYTFDSKMDTRSPATVKTSGENGEVIETKQYFNPTEVYAGNAYAKFVSYETINADDVIDNTTPNVEQTPTQPEEEDGFTVSLDVTLQISSIIIAIILIGVIATILVRDGLKKRAKRRQKTQAYYEEVSGFDRNTREKTLKKIAEKKANIKLASDDEEYDYDVAEQIDENEEIVDEEIIEDEVKTESEEVLDDIIETPETTEETTSNQTEKTSNEE